MTKSIYINEDSILEAYTVLTSLEYDYFSEIFHLLILKKAGINQYNYIDLKSTEIQQSIFNTTKQLAYLFLDEKKINIQYNFINPLKMNSWNNNPSESLKKWTTSRLKNNIIGGGKQWRNIILTDDNNPDFIKLKHNYLSYFTGNTNKINLCALTIWFYKFSTLESYIPLSSLINSFLLNFNISSEEKILFFTTSPTISLNYSEHRINSHIIRNLIGNPSKNPMWLNENKQSDDIFLTTSPSPSITLKERFDLSSTQNTNTDHLKNTLNKVHQLILMGPPGTSKSFMAKNLADSFSDSSKTKRIQFHPQYLYQDFIVGKSLVNGTLTEEKGEFITFLDDAMSNYEDPNQTTIDYILVIEEINRANISQVFGEVIQLLDRGEKLKLTFNNEEKYYYLPNNLKIIGTMNTTDRTIGRIDFAIKRRFYQIYYGVDYSLITDLVSLEENLFSCRDFLEKINTNLLSMLRNKEMVIGHAILFKNFARNENNTYTWSLEDFKDLFYYMILPIIEDYCNNDPNLISNIIGDTLPHEVNKKDFLNAVLSFLI